MLTAITPDGPTTTETFFKADAAATWIERENASRNIYLMAAEATGTLRKKASKDDVARTRHLWADIDGDGDLRGRLNGHVPPPTMIVASGGGLNVYWALASPIEDVAEIEARNRWLSEQSRAAITAGTATASFACPARSTGPTPRRGARAARPSWPAAPSTTRTASMAPTTSGGSRATRRRSASGSNSATTIPLLTLDDLPAEVREKLPARARRLIQEGPRPDEYRGDRSKAVLAVTCALVRAGASDAQIAGILLNPDLPIHAHIRDQKGHGPRAYVARQIERARERVEADAAQTAHGAALAAGLLGNQESSHGAEAEC